jgi:hypothetical protein
LLIFADFFKSLFWILNESPTSGFMVLFHCLVFKDHLAR